MSDKPSGHWGRKLLRTFERSPAALMTRQPTSAVSHNSSVRLTRSVRRQAASFKRACVDRTDQIKSWMVGFVQTAFWEVRTEPFGSCLAHDASSNRKATAL